MLPSLPVYMQKGHSSGRPVAEIKGIRGKKQAFDTPANGFDPLQHPIIFHRDRAVARSFSPASPDDTIPTLYCIPFGQVKPPDRRPKSPKETIEHLHRYGFRRAGVHRRRGEASLASGEVMSANDTASEVITSITVGTRAANASCKAGANAAGSSTRVPRQPIARAIAAWSNSWNSAANGPEPCSTQPSALLLNTTTTIAMSCSSAVISPFIVIANPPSPQTATTARSGWTSLAASAAGMANPIGQVGRRVEKAVRLAMHRDTPDRRRAALLPARAHFVAELTKDHRRIAEHD